jgi:K+-sensing histidine kinase KdpD
VTSRLRLLTWPAVLAGVTAALVPFRVDLDHVYVALAYVLVVLFAAARSGRGVAITTALLAFLSFDWFFIPPFDTLVVASPLGWVMLGAFLTTSVVVAQLLHHARMETQRATRLEESHRAKDAVLASVSHDLRTPLTTIKSLAHELAEQGDERAVVIEEEADRLTRFVSDLLDLSRIASGMPLDIQPNEAEDLLGAVAQRVSGRLSDRELKILHDAGEAILIGRFDFAQTLRAIVNLVENAAKYSPAGTDIDLSVKRVSDTLEFSVSDRGPGVPADERERIFEPFYRRSDVRRDPTGTGLGLSIARSIASAQGGSLVCESRDGGGSVFTLRVPAMDLTSLASS